MGPSETVAAMQEASGKGFLLISPDVSSKRMAKVADGLMSTSQQRGLMRREYAHRQFQDNLLDF